MRYFLHIESITCFLILLLVPAGFMILPGCSWIPQPSAGNAFEQARIKTTIERVSQNYNRVSSFVTSGKAAFRNWAWGSEATILIIGQRKPLRLKIELTHSWGRPILHLLIRDEKLEILSFSESRLYRGAYSSETLSKFINIYPDMDLLWSIVRGYPELKSYDHLVPSGSDHLLLADRSGGELEKIGIDRNTFEISSISFPGSDITVSFSEYRTAAGIPYAGEVRVDTPGSGRHLILFYENMVFNREIPQTIFEMRMPPGFEIINLDNVSPEAISKKMTDHGD